MKKKMRSSRVVTVNSWGTIASVITAVLAWANQLPLSDEQNTIALVIAATGALWNVINVVLRIQTSQPVDVPAWLAWLKSTPKADQPAIVDPTTDPPTIIPQQPQQPQQGNNIFVQGVMTAISTALVMLGIRYFDADAPQPVEPATPTTNESTEMTGPLPSSVIRGEPIVYRLPSDVEQPHFKVVKRSTALDDPKVEFADGGRTANVSSASPGMYHVFGVGLRDGKVVAWQHEHTVDLPAPDKPADPQPQPTTPTKPAEPPPSTWPISDVGLRVLIVWESHSIQDYPANIRQIIESNRLRLQLDTLCVEDGWRIWDADVPIVRPLPTFQKMMALPRENVPWLVISGADGRRGVSRKLTESDTVDSLIAEVTTYK